jgi:hypothetical protein
VEPGTSRAVEIGNVQPRRPKALPEIAEAILVALSREPLSANIVLGGGVALKHYVDYRDTQDINAWWRLFPDPVTLTTVHTLLAEIARDHGCRIEHRHFGGTDSLEFKREGRNSKVFSFQISIRDVPLDEPLVSAWAPLLIETTRDNIGSKMNALVNRGSPRDFLDIYHVVNDGLSTSAECWTLWHRKNAGAEITDAQGQIRSHLNRLEQRRPLDTITNVTERDAAASLRQWYKTTFLVDGRSE